MTARVMDARHCASRFVVRRSRDAPDPRSHAGTGTRLEGGCSRIEAWRSVAVFDKFLKDEEHPSLKRQLVNAFAKPLFSDLNRRLGPLIAGTPLVIEHDEPIALRDLSCGDAHEAHHSEIVEHQNQRRSPAHKSSAACIFTGRFREVACLSPFVVPRHADIRCELA